jgi:phenylacetate-CoA ligase
MLKTVATDQRSSLAPPPTLLSLRPEAVAAERAAFPIRLFQAAAARVPAYKDFLAKNGVAPAKIMSAADFRSVPPVDKKNYVSQYALEELCWDGTLKNKKLVYTATSGSTGVPYYFPRDAALEERIMLELEPYLRSLSPGRQPTTLAIVSFGMGVWIGGVIVYQAFRLLGDRGYPVAVIAPGTNKKEIFEALAKIAPKYEQVILCGYPPFIKDVLDEAPEHGFDPSKRPLKLLFAAEAFSETFRDYVMRKAGTTDPLRDSANIYGSAELGAMAIETPLSIALRRRALEDKKLYSDLFSDAGKLPTLAQFHPGIVHFEEQDGVLLLTGDNALPLIRYAIGDRGGVVDYDAAMAAAEASSPGFAEKERDAVAQSSPLPFVYVYERSDFAVKLYGAIIYAEHVRAALQVRALEASVTGKFSMSTEHDERQDEYLDVHVELKRGIEATEDLRLRVRDAVVTGLRERNAEYRYLSDNLKERVLPHLALWPLGHPEHFGAGGKQRWIKKPKQNV